MLQNLGVVSEEFVSLGSLNWSMNALVRGVGAKWQPDGATWEDQMAVEGQTSTTWNHLLSSIMG